MSDFQIELKELINSHSRENGSNTPDYLLAQYMLSCLEAAEQLIRDRDKWYGPLPPSPVSESEGSDEYW